MGVDLHYQALPDDCVLLRRARDEPEFGACLEFFRKYASPAPLKLSSAEKSLDDFIREAQEVVVGRPHLLQLNFDLGRRWDWMHYLLSDKRRRGQAKDLSGWVERAIFGGDVLKEETQTTIGIPIRYLPPSQVLGVADELEATPIESLRYHWNPKAMSRMSVYKIHPDEGDEAFAYVEEDLDGLRAFYREVARHEEGVLALMS